MSNRQSYRMHWCVLMAVFAIWLGTSSASASPLYDPDNDLFAGYDPKYHYPVSQAQSAALAEKNESLHLLAKLLATLTLKSSEDDILDSKNPQKRSSYWRPMGGPLPVQTRFVSFGSRLEPDHTKEEGPVGIKAMRYGRRRR